MFELTERRTETTKTFAGEWDEATYSRELKIREYAMQIHEINEESGMLEEIVNTETLDNNENYTETTLTEFMARKLGY